MRSLFVGAWLALAASPAAADISYLESGIGITFEGCDYDRLINLKNGYIWECGEYGYTYHYGKLTVLDVSGNTMLCVGDVDAAIEEFPGGECYSGRLYRR
jgi:hypothetical protein